MKSLSPIALYSRSTSLYNAPASSRAGCRALHSALQLYSSTTLYILHPLHPPSGDDTVSCKKENRSQGGMGGRHERWATHEPVDLFVLRGLRSSLHVPNVTVQKKDVAGVDAFCARLAQPQAPHYLHIPPPARCGARAAGVCEGVGEPPGSTLLDLPHVCSYDLVGWLSKACGG